MPRAIWKDAISFGLVRIQVALQAESPLLFHVHRNDRYRPVAAHPNSPSTLPRLSA